MHYEEAPATKLLATHCACCARPLVDAKSVECGVGPDCRKMHGFDVDVSDAARVEANGLVYRIAAQQDGPEVLAMTDRLRALGFEKLAARIAERLATIRIERVGGRVIVRAPYSPESVAAFRAIPGRKFEKEGKDARNTFPEGSARQVLGALRKCFPGATASGPKGLFVLVA